jgi:hypothetical protein
MELGCKCGRFRTSKLQSSVTIPLVVVNGLDGLGLFQLLEFSLRAMYI